MLFINFLCLLYLMVLADSHTISKSIYNDDKVDNNIYESIHDVDRPTNPRTRRDRQHKYKLYSNKEEDVAPPDVLREKKAYELDKTTEKNTLKTTAKLTTDHAKQQKTSKRKVSFWKKLRGKDKKKETNKHHANERERRICNHKKEQIDHVVTKDSRNPDPKTNGRRRNKKQFFPAQPELKISKREASAFFPTVPYSNTARSVQLQMGIASYDNNLLSDSLIGELENLNSKISLLKKMYGVDVYIPSKTGFPSKENTKTLSCLNTKIQEIFNTPKLDLGVTGQIEIMLNSMKARNMQIAFEKPLVSGLIKSCVTEATFNNDRHEYNRLLKPGMPAPGKGLSTYVSVDDIQTVGKRTAETAESERTDETDDYYLNDSIFSASTESHYIAARSIRGNSMTIAQNVEDMLQRELKHMYNKVRHKVSNDLRKEVHTVKSTVKATYSKITAKLSSKCKANATCPATFSTTTKPTKAKPEPKTSSCACKITTQKKLKSLATTTSPRLKKEDDKDDGKIITAENFTPDTLYAKSYDDYMMLTLYEQMLAKTHDDNIRKMLATSEYPLFPNIKREALRLSKRNPETLTDVKLKEAIQNIYDDGINMPDYDYIDPLANITSTGRTTAANYNELDYANDLSGSSDNSAQDPLVKRLELNNKGKGTASAPAEANTNTEGNNSPAAGSNNSPAAGSNNASAAGSNNASAAGSGNTDSTLSDVDGLSRKISYKEFVDGYKHYLNFQKDQSNQNFSNLIKYQAHRHHSVDDIGKYILNKIPSLPTYNKWKREQRFSDDSDNNMDYQEITTRSDDSWFKKHFYLFIDNGPPKKYHTSETVELKPTEPKLYLTEPTSRISQTKELLIKIDRNNISRKAKEAEESPNLDDLSKVLDSIKKQQTDSQSPQGKTNTEKAMPLSGDDDATQVKSFISKVFTGKRRNAPKKDSITTVYFPTTRTYNMFADSMKGRLRRSITKENIDTIMLTDYMTKNLEEKASTVTKELFVDTAPLGNKETNKYGYVDIDLVPRQTAIVKLRDDKKSRIKNFFSKFNFKKKKKKDSKPKRSCYYNYNVQNRKKGRFNPIEKLKAIFNVKEVKENVTEKFPIYDIANTELDSYKPITFVKPMSLEEMQKQVPNISDTYYEPPAPPTKTTISASKLFRLDAKDEDLLYNFHPSTASSTTASSKQSAANQKTTHQQAKQFSNATLKQLAAIKSKRPIGIASNRSELMRVPSCNVMTVNVKTMKTLPSTTLMSTETSPPLTVDDMGLILNKMHINILKNQEEFPKLNTMYNPSQVRQTQFENKKNIPKTRLISKIVRKQPALSKIVRKQPTLSKNVRKQPELSKNAFDELVIKSKLTRIAKFPIPKRRYKMKNHDDSESNSGVEGPFLEYIHDLGSRNASYEKKRKAKGMYMRQVDYPHQPKPNSKNKDRYTDYLKELRMRHNDILNMDTVPNPQWTKILKPIHSDARNRYTTPNMNKLLIELNEMNNMMNLGSNKTINMFPNRSLSEGSRYHVSARAHCDQKNEHGLIRNVVMQDNALVTSDDLIIRGEAKYYQYNKAKLDENKRNANDLKKKLNKLNFVKEEWVVPFNLKGGRRSSPNPFLKYPEPTIIVDTTLLAYDDDVDYVTKALKPLKNSRNSRKTKVRNKIDISFKNAKNKTSVDTAKNSQKSGKPEPKNKMERPVFIRTNSAPMQYYTTPLPMKSNEFDKFLKEHNMDIDFVTSPLLDLPAIKDWAAKKQNYKPISISNSNDIPTSVEEAKQAKSSLKEAAPAMQEAASSMQEAAPAMQDPAPPATKEAAQDMKEAAPSMEEAAPSIKEAAPLTQVAAPPMQDIAPAVQKIAPFTQEAAALGKSLKFTSDHPKGKLNQQNPVNASINQLAYWDDDFNRYRRYSEVKIVRNTARPTQEANHYSNIKKKMKERLFEKKATPTTPLDRLATDTDTIPQNKEVEITIIDFDDIDKVTSQLPYYETFSFPATRKEEIGNYTDYGEVSNIIKAKNKTKTRTTLKSTEVAMPIEEIHNELLYKNVFNEHSSTTSPKKYFTKCLSKSTEYVNPIMRDGQIGTGNKMRYPIEKMPIYPNILSKVPQHVKNFNSIPKRVHISSHHYKYDVFYDDMKNAAKMSGIEGLRPKLIRTTTNGWRPSNVTTKPTSAIRGSEASHKKRKYFTFRGCRQKTTVRLTEPIPTTEFFEMETISSAPATNPVVTVTPFKKVISAAVDNTAEEAQTISSTDNIAEFSTRTEPLTSVEESYGKSSWTRSSGSVSDIEDVVIMLDKQDDIEDVVTLSAIQSEYFTDITLKDGVRRTLSAPSPPTITTTRAQTKAAITRAPTMAATTRAPTKATTTRAATKAVTTRAPTKATTSQPGSLVYHLKQLKPATSKPNHKQKKSSGDKDRHARLFKISSILHDRFKSIMKNRTTSTMRTSVTPLRVNATKLSSKILKRTCIIFTHDSTPAMSTTEPETSEMRSGEVEGFKVMYSTGSGSVFSGPEVNSEMTLEEHVEENEGFKAKFTLLGHTLSLALEPKTHAPAHRGVTSCQSNCRRPEKPPPHGSVHHHYHHLPPPAHEESEEPCPNPPPSPPAYHRCHTTHKGKGKCKELPVHGDTQDSVIYQEPQIYNDQQYYEQSQHLPPIPTQSDDCGAHSDNKREAPLDTYTAKDVAALEVIIDLMKNTLSYEENNMASAYHERYDTNPINANGSTNAIQVHIAIPYDFQNEKKRSPCVPGPVRVRKVFCAKMSTPVDLEYQVHSFEGTIPPTSTIVTNSINYTENALSPGMYLIIDKPKSGYGLKPILGQINLSDLKSRQVTAGTTPRMSESKPTETREETTSMKSLAKVKLSKDFVAAVNQQLIEMYENMSRVNKDVESSKRPARSVWKSRNLKEKEGRDRIAEKYIVKRGINWEAVKHFFSRDRVCNCKCKSNTTMCRACAASDAVIDELIFEFDNIGRYMSDHCTEIQTFFWMNPIGGQKLRESVNKIDKSLTDYYKRVGKCQGKKCNTFTTYIDKRSFTKTFKVKKEDSVSRFMNDLAVLAEDLNRTISLKVCYNEKLKKSGDKFIQLIKSHIIKKEINKRSNPSTRPAKRLIKNVYSLDKINVNIICHPESSTTDEQMFTAAITELQDTSQRMNDHLLDFDLEETKETKHKKHNSLKKLFPRKNKKSKLLSYFEFKKEPKTNYKRQVDTQVVTPLISDGGGAFWYDYIRAGSNEPRLVRDSIKGSPPNKEITVVQKVETTAEAITKSPSTDSLVSNNIYMSVETKPERNQRDIDMTTDSLSQNIKQMLQLFGSLQDIEAINDNSNRSIKCSKNVTEIKKESQHKKPTLIAKVKQKMAWSKNKTTTSTAHQQARATLDKELQELETVEYELDLESKTIASKYTFQNGTRNTLDDNKNMITTTAKAMVVNTTTFSPTTNMISITAKTETTNSPANPTTVARITDLAREKKDKTETTPRSVNKTTTKLGFMNKLKAATKLFRKDENTQTRVVSLTVRETKTPTTTGNGTDLIIPLNSDVIDTVTDINKKVMDYVIEESTQSTTQNPTIVIINEYGNKINSESIDDKEGFKNLLLSIIQFETNNLNDEWDRIAYAGDKHNNDADMKRSIVVKPETAAVKPREILMVTTLPPTTSLYEVSYPVVDKTTKQPEGLLNKLVSKMGIKVINNNKKKVVKKASIREVRKDRKNFIKNRKLRINSIKPDTPSPASKKKARDSRRAAKPSQICDIQATYDQIKSLQKTLPGKAFEMVARNITCYKHKNADAVFVIPYKRKGKRWDWIRNKRSSKLHFYEKNVNFDDNAYTVNFEDDPNDLFERYAKGDDGIYKIVKRRKRTANLEALERGLTNIPALIPGEDELFVLAGDSVTMDCGLHTPVRTCDGKFLWKTDRNRMLKQDNVYVDDVSLTINNVEPKNVGTYTCSRDHTVRKNVRLNVLTIPSFDVVFLPVYKTQDNCSYDDLKAIQRLGSLMAKENRCGKTCSVRIDEPVCQRDKGTNSTLVRAAAVISMAPRELNCSLQCKRDIISSLVMLCATNTAVLSSIRVLVSKDGVIETLTPWRELVRPVVTHTLRKKDTNGHHEYHKLVSLLSPGKVDVVLICPAGYYLLPKYKLCSSCPSNTCSKVGDNTCRSCPRGTRSEPGASKCHLVQTHPRRYDWWWYPPCGYVVACCGVLFGCTACVLLSLIVHLLSRDAEVNENEGGNGEGQKTPMTMRNVTVAYAHIPDTRPLSPSRVILPRFFKPSLTLSRATDSQETKFELWKERNRPPPLPPIDFDP